jgi:uncharacterized membrane protein
MRDFLLTIHILAVCLWLGGSIMNGIMNRRIMNNGDANTLATTFRAQAKMGLTFYMPLSIVTLLTGIGLVVNSDAGFSMGDPWVSLGFVTVIVAAILGPVKLQPLTDQAIEQFEAGELEAGKKSAMDIGKFSSITTGLLILTVIAMVVKP